MATYRTCVADANTQKQELEDTKVNSLRQIHELIKQSDQVIKLVSWEGWGPCHSRGGLRASSCSALCCTEPRAGLQPHSQFSTWQLRASPPPVPPPVSCPDFLPVVFRPPSPSTRSCTCRRRRCPFTSKPCVRAASCTTPGSNMPRMSSSCSEGMSPTRSTTSSLTCPTAPGRRGGGNRCSSAPTSAAGRAPADRGCLVQEQKASTSALVDSHYFWSGFSSIPPPASSWTWPFSSLPTTRSPFTRTRKGSFNASDFSTSGGSDGAGLPRDGSSTDGHRETQGGTLAERRGEKSPALSTACSKQTILLSELLCVASGTAPNGEPFFPQQGGDTRCTNPGRPPPKLTAAWIPAQVGAESGPSFTFWWSPPESSTSLPAALSFFLHFSFLSFPLSLYLFLPVPSSPPFSFPFPFSFPKTPSELTAGPNLLEQEGTTKPVLHPWEGAAPAALDSLGCLIL